MTGKDALALEEDGYIEFNEKRGVYEEIDEEGIFMQTLPTDDDRHDSDAEDLKREAAEDEPFNAMADAGMSMSDFV